MLMIYLEAPVMALCSKELNYLLMALFDSDMVFGKPSEYRLTGLGFSHLTGQT